MMMMINFKIGLWINLILAVIIFTTEVSSKEDNALDNLYDNLLQREYTGQIPFPEYTTVERKAQRSSPSLRLRFGRSDPSFADINKRWFGDVNQKPIRSPSFRLRFGKRNNYEDYDQVPDNVYYLTPGQQLAKLESWLSDYTDEEESNSAEMARKIRAPSLRLRYGRSGPTEDLTEAESKRAAPSLRLRYGRSVSTKRAPSMRLRWGRSGAGNTLNENETSKENSERTNQLLSSLGYSKESIKLLLNALRQIEYDYYNQDDDSNNLDSNEFNRDSRQSRANGPVRLRWGRSVGYHNIIANDMAKPKLQTTLDDNKLQSNNHNLPSSTLTSTSSSIQG